MPVNSTPPSNSNSNSNNNKQKINRTKTKSFTCQNDNRFSVEEYDAKFFPSGENAQAVISAL